MQITGQKAFLARPENPYITFAKRRARGQNSSVNNEKYGNVLVKGEEGERDTLCTQGDVTGRHARERGNDDASALGCEGYPATHYFNQSDVAVATT